MKRWEHDQWAVYEYLRKFPCSSVGEIAWNIDESEDNVGRVLRDLKFSKMVKIDPRSREGGVPYWSIDRVVTFIITECIALGNMYRTPRAQVLDEMVYAFLKTQQFGARTQRIAEAADLTMWATGNSLKNLEAAGLVSHELLDIATYTSFDVRWRVV